MTLKIRKTHWIVFSLLLAMQVMGLAAIAHRGLDSSNIDWLYLGWFAVPRDFHGMFVAVTMVTSHCFVTALIIVPLLGVLRHSHK